MVPNVRRWGAEGGDQQGVEGEALGGKFSERRWYGRRDRGKEAQLRKQLKTAVELRQTGGDTRGSSVRLYLGLLNY